MVVLGYFDDKQAVFPKEWLEKKVKEEFEMDLDTFINEFYTYDTVEGLMMMARQEGIEYKLFEIKEFCNIKR